MSKITSYELISPHEFKEHPERKKVFPDSIQPYLEAYKDSIKREGKINPVIYTEESREKLVIDGWKYVKHAQENNESSVAALKIDIDRADIPQLLIELHRNYHLSISEEYKMCSYLYEKLKLQSGYRSDVRANEELGEQDEEPELTDPQSGGKKRRPTVYDKVGAIMGISANRVKQLLKVGQVNPLYFERIDKERNSLYAAYCRCIAEERGVEPAVPSVRKTVYVTTNTPTPQFGSESQTTETPFVYIQSDTQSQAQNIETTEDESSNKSKLVYTVHKQVCPHCGEIFEFIPPKSNEL